MPLVGMTISKYFSRAEVGSESAFIDDIVGQAQAHFLRNDAAGAVGDVGEGTSVHCCGSALGGLDKIGEDGFGEQRHHSAGSAEFFCADRFAVVGRADDDGVEAFAKIVAAAGQREDGHDFTGGGDDEAGVTIGAFAFAADFDGDAAESAVVHVHAARPGDAGGIESKLVAVEEVSVDERGQKIVRGSDGVEVAVEVEIYFLAGLQLGHAAAGGAAFHAEDRAEGGFARGDDGFFADVLEALRQADGGDGFAFAGNGWRGGGYED